MLSSASIRVADGRIGEIQRAAHDLAQGAEEAGNSGRILGQQRSHRQQKHYGKEHQVAYAVVGRTVAEFDQAGVDGVVLKNTRPPANGATSATICFVSVPIPGRMTRGRTINVITRKARTAAAGRGSAGPAGLFNPGGRLRKLSESVPSCWCGVLQFCPILPCFARIVEPTGR